MFRQIGFFRRNHLTDAEMNTHEIAMRNADQRPGYNTRQSVRDTDPVGRIPIPVTVVPTPAAPDPDVSTPKVQ